MRLQLAEGLPAEGDVLIGADGAGSFIRRVLHPEEPPPRPSGLIAVRGAVHGVRHHLGDRDAVFYLGPGIESMLVRASETAIYWFLSMALELLPTDTRGPAAILAQMAPQFDETFRAVTAATEDLRVDELFDRDPLPFWGTGPVTLLGDAAHPLLPQTGQGAAQALVDAVTLGKTLRDVGDVGDVEPALREYERQRRSPTAALVGQGRRTARLMRTRNPVACYLREVALRLAPVETIARFYVRINRRAGTA